MLRPVPHRSDTRFYSGSRVPGRSDPIACAGRIDREIDSRGGLGAKPRAVGALVGEWEAGKMVLCNPNLPDLAADSVAGHPGAMLHKRRMTGHLQPVIRRIFPANAAHTPHSNQSPADAPRLPARPVSTSPFFIKSPLPFSVTPF